MTFLKIDYPLKGLDMNDDLLITVLRRMKSPSVLSTSYLSTVGADFICFNHDVILSGNELRTVRFQCWILGIHPHFRGVIEMYVRGTLGLLFSIQDLDDDSFRHVMNFIEVYHQSTAKWRRTLSPLPVLIYVFRDHILKSDNVNDEGFLKDEIDESAMKECHDKLFIMVHQLLDQYPNLRFGIFVLNDSDDKTSFDAGLSWLSREIFLALSLNSGSTDSRPPIICNESLNFHFHRSFGIEIQKKLKIRSWDQATTLVISKHLPLLDDVIRSLFSDSREARVKLERMMTSLIEDIKDMGIQLGEKFFRSHEARNTLENELGTVCSDEECIIRHVQCVVEKVIVPETCWKAWNQFLSPYLESKIVDLSWPTSVDEDAILTWQSGLGVQLPDRIMISQWIRRLNDIRLFTDHQFMTEEIERFVKNFESFKLSMVLRFLNMDLRTVHLHVNARRLLDSNLGPQILFFDAENVIEDLIAHFSCCGHDKIPFLLYSVFQLIVREIQLTCSNTNDKKNDGGSMKWLRQSFTNWLEATNQDKYFIQLFMREWDAYIEEILQTLKEQSSWMQVMVDVACIALKANVLHHEVFESILQEERIYRLGENFWIHVVQELLMKHPSLSFIEWQDGKRLGLQPIARKKDVNPSIHELIPLLNRFSFLPMLQVMKDLLGSHFNENNLDLKMTKPLVIFACQQALESILSSRWIVSPSLTRRTCVASFTKELMGDMGKFQLVIEPRHGISQEENWPFIVIIRCPRTSCIPKIQVLLTCQICCENDEELNADNSTYFTPCIVPDSVDGPSSSFLIDARSQRIIRMRGAVGELMMVIAKVTWLVDYAEELYRTRHQVSDAIEGSPSTLSSSKEHQDGNAFSTFRHVPSIFSQFQNRFGRCKHFRWKLSS